MLHRNLKTQTLQSNAGLVRRSALYCRRVKNRQHQRRSTTRLLDETNVSKFEQCIHGDRLYEGLNARDDETVISVLQNLNEECQVGDFNTSLPERLMIVLYQLLEHNNVNIVSQCLRLLINFTEITQDYNQLLIGEKLLDLVMRLIKKFETRSVINHREVLCRCIVFLANLCLGGSSQCLQHVLSKNVIHTIDRLFLQHECPNLRGCLVYLSSCLCKDLSMIHEPQSFTLCKVLLYGLQVDHGDPNCFIDACDGATALMNQGVILAYDLQNINPFMNYMFGVDENLSAAACDVMVLMIKTSRQPLHLYQRIHHFVTNSVGWLNPMTWCRFLAFILPKYSGDNEQLHQEWFHPIQHLIQTPQSVDTQLEVLTGMSLCPPQRISWFLCQTPLSIMLNQCLCNRKLQAVIVMHDMISKVDVIDKSFRKSLVQALSRDAIAAIDLARYDIMPTVQQCAHKLCMMMYEDEKE